MTFGYPLLVGRSSSSTTTSRGPGSGTDPSAAPRPRTGIIPRRQRGKNQYVANETAETAVKH